MSDTINRVVNHHAKTSKNQTSQTPPTRTPNKEILEAALREIDQGEAIVDEHQRVLSKIADAIKARKLSGPPKQNVSKTTALSHTVLERILKLQKAWEQKTMTDDQLKEETEAALELIRQHVKELNADLAIAKAHYRPIERARGH